ncbi:MAG: metallophosphatase family protein [Candidatus Krumholzibacteria bacterium]|nr:metallophosphatase family protein [Candidatus Krumholzibacteria bacterium]
MKIFVCSDIHGNFRAFEAVLSEYRKGGPYEFLFLGDALGYGTHPDAILDRLFNLPRSVLLFGNHEWSLFDRAERAEMNDIAMGSILWSERMMGGRYDQRIGERFQLTAEGRGYIAAHSSPTNPLEWRYVFTSADAAPIFMNHDFRVCFVGHTHVPMVYTFNDGLMGLPESGTLVLDPGDRYVINPGSVGQPRDGDSRASFCIYDPDENRVSFERCRYDVEAEADDIVRAGLDPFLADRLLKGY